MAAANLAIALVPFAPLLALPPRLVATAASCACLLGGAALGVARVRAGEPRAAEVATAAFAAVGASLAVSAWWLLASGGVGTVDGSNDERGKGRWRRGQEAVRGAVNSGSGGSGAPSPSSSSSSSLQSQRPLALAARFASVPWKAEQRASKSGKALCPFTGERASLRCPCCRTTVSRNAWHAGDKFSGLSLGGGPLLWQPAEAALEKEDSPMESRIKLDTALNLKGNFLFAAVSPCCIGCARALKTTNLLPRLGATSACVALALALVPWGLGASLRQLDGAAAGASAGSRVAATALCLALWCAAQCAAALAHAVGAAVTFAESYDCCRFFEGGEGGEGFGVGGAGGGSRTFAVSNSQNQQQQGVTRSKLSTALISLAAGPKWRGAVGGAGSTGTPDAEGAREKERREVATQTETETAAAAASSST